MEQIFGMLNDEAVKRYQYFLLLFNLEALKSYNDLSLNLWVFKLRTVVGRSLILVHSQSLKIIGCEAASKKLIVVPVLFYIYEMFLEKDC